MKKTFSKIALFSLIAVGIVGIVFGLNKAIANVQANEDSKVISESFDVDTLDSVNSLMSELNSTNVDTQVVESTPMNINEISDEIAYKEVKWEWQKPYEPSTPLSNEVEPTVLEASTPLSNEAEPSEPLSDERKSQLQIVARIAAETILEYFDVDVSDELFVLNYTGNALVDRELIYSNCITDDFIYSVDMDEITGKIYSVSRAPRNISSYTGAEKDVYSYRYELYGEEDEETVRNQQMSDPAYIKVVEDYVREKFPDKKVSAVKNIYQGSMAGFGLDICTVLTAVDFTDGSGYMFKMGAESRFILDFTYYPNGVVNYLKEEYESAPEKLSVYDSLDD